MAPHSYSIASLRCFHRRTPLAINALLCVLLLSDNCDWGMVNGFEVVPSSSRYTAPKRIIQQYSESSSSFRCNSKYDLGLGKNGPIHPQPKGRQIQQQQQQQGSERVETTTAYEACQFLVEHEATRLYPAPNNDNNSVVNNNKGAQSVPDGDQSLAVPGADTETTPTISSSSNQLLERKAEGRRTHTRTDTASAVAPPPSEQTHKGQRKRHPVKVQPKRFLEDCLTILDHDDLSLSDAASPATTATITAATTNSTIFISSRPDTPQLDMNSIWVEMLLHNQMARSSQTQG